MDTTGYNLQNAHMLLAHCAVAARKFSHREMSKRELISKIKSLTQFSVDRAFRSHLADVESHVNDLIKKERRILTAAKQQQALEHSLQGKINALEEKLSSYVEQRAVHERQLKELEAKVSFRMKRRQQVHELRIQIKALEDLYDEISQERYRYDPSKISAMEKRLANLKTQLQKSEGK